MNKDFLSHLQTQIEEVKSEGLYKKERVIDSQQAADIHVTSGESVLNFCANNYLGLANSPELIEAGKAALDKQGYGMASVRFICGTQDVHKELESRISDFLGMEDTILYSSCFDANTGLFETILSKEDAIISDSLNHASIIDGVRLCKAKRYRYANNNMEALEDQLKQADADGARFKVIAPASFAAGTSFKVALIAFLLFSDITRSPLSCETNIPSFSVLREAILALYRSTRISISFMRFSNCSFSTRVF